MTTCDDATSTGQQLYASLLEGLTEDHQQDASVLRLLDEIRALADLRDLHERDILERGIYTSVENAGNVYTKQNPSVATVLRISGEMRRLLASLPRRAVESGLTAEDRQAEARLAAYFRGERDTP